MTSPRRNLVILGWASEAGDFPDENSLPWVSFPRHILFPVACLSQGTVLPVPLGMVSRARMASQPGVGDGRWGGAAETSLVSKSGPCRNTALVSRATESCVSLAKLLLQLCKVLWLHLPPQCVVSYLSWSGAPPKTQSSQGIGPVFFKLAIS